MREKLQNQYDKIYASKEVVFGNGEPIKAVQKIPNYLASGTVLDIGGGEGRNALYLAEQGFSVSVVDISSVGIEKLRVAAEQKSLDINAEVRDIVVEGITGQYDSVVWSFVLHHIDAADAVKLIEDSKHHTNDGGVHVISTFSNAGDLFERSIDSKRFYPDIATMNELYSDWDIQEISEHETTTAVRNDEGEQLKNLVVTIIATKKS